MFGSYGVGRLLPGPPTLAFLAQRRDNGDIFLLDIERAHLHNLTRHPAYDRAPAWSPDGRHLAFISDRSGAPLLYVMSIPGAVQQPEPLTTLPVASGSRPVWSPDGRSIVFEVQHTGNTELYLIDMTCTVERRPCQPEALRLTHEPTDDRFPVWSPDGSMIAFVSWRQGDAEIFAISPDGTDVRNLTQHPAWDVGPSWSPDGHYLAFFSVRANYRELYIMAADGSDPRQITFHNNPYNAYNSGPPAWSPDGRRMALVTVFESNADVTLIEASCLTEGERCTDEGTKIAPSAAADVSPFWSPDGRWLYFLSDRTGPLMILRADPDCPRATICTPKNPDCPRCPPQPITGRGYYSVSPVWRP